MPNQLNFSFNPQAYSLLRNSRARGGCFVNNTCREAHAGARQIYRHSTPNALDVAAELL